MRLYIFESIPPVLRNSLTWEFYPLNGIFAVMLSRDSACHCCVDSITGDAKDKEYVPKRCVASTDERDVEGAQRRWNNPSLSPIWSANSYSCLWLTNASADILGHVYLVFWHIHMVYPRAFIKVVDSVYSSKSAPAQLYYIRICSTNISRPSNNSK